MSTRRSIEPKTDPAARSETPRRGARPHRAAAAPTVGVAAETRRAMIAESAYLRAERRAFAPGHETEDWLAAEEEVDALLKEHGGSPQ